MSGQIIISPIRKGEKQRTHGSMTNRILLQKVRYTSKYKADGALRCFKGLRNR